MICLELPGVTVILPHQRRQLTTRWWSVDSSTPLFTQCPRHMALSPTTQPQSGSLKCGLGCPGAKCTYGHPYALTWYSLWTICDQHRSPITEPHSGWDLGGRSSRSRLSRSNCPCQCGRWSPPVELWNPQKEPCCTPSKDSAVWPIGTNNSKDPPPHLKAEGGHPLIHRGKLQHTGTDSGGNEYRHPRSAPLPGGNSRVEESPTPLESTGSRVLVP